MKDLRFAICHTAEVGYALAVISGASPDKTAMLAGRWRVRVKH